MSQVRILPGAPSCTNNLLTPGPATPATARIAIPDVGVTQSRTLADAGKWASDLVEAMTGTAGAVVHITPVVSGVNIDAIQAARQELATAEEAIAHASITIPRRRPRRHRIWDDPS